MVRVMMKTYHLTLISPTLDTLLMKVKLNIYHVLLIQKIHNIKQKSKINYI